LGHVGFQRALDQAVERLAATAARRGGAAGEDAEQRLAEDRAARRLAHRTLRVVAATRRGRTLRSGLARRQLGRQLGRVELLLLVPGAERVEDRLEVVARHGRQRAGDQAVLDAAGARHGAGGARLVRRAARQLQHAPLGHGAKGGPQRIPQAMRTGQDAAGPVGARRVRLSDGHGFEEGAEKSGCPFFYSFLLLGAHPCSSRNTQRALVPLCLGILLE
jgi:hypothetical protein